MKPNSTPPWIICFIAALGVVTLGAIYACRVQLRDVSYRPTVVTNEATKMITITNRNYGELVIVTNAAPYVFDTTQSKVLMVWIDGNGKIERMVDITKSNWVLTQEESK